MGKLESEVHSEEDSDEDDVYQEQGMPQPDQDTMEIDDEETPEPAGTDDENEMVG